MTSNKAALTRNNTRHNTVEEKESRRIWKKSRLHSRLICFHISFLGHPTSVLTSYEINFAKDTTELCYFDEATAQTTARSYKEANSKLSICH